MGSTCTHRQTYAQMYMHLVFVMQGTEIVYELLIMGGEEETELNFICCLKT